MREFTMFLEKCVNRSPKKCQTTCIFKVRMKDGVIFCIFLNSGDTCQEIDKGRFPPFGSVLPEFELWEAVLRQFWMFFDLGVFGRSRVRAFRFFMFF